MAPLKIFISCCNHLFAEGLKQLLKVGGTETNYRVGILDPEEEISSKIDLMIVDYYALSLMSLHALFEHKIKILLVLTGCLSKIEDHLLLEYLSRGLIGVLPPKSNVTQLKKAIQCTLAGELWIERSVLKSLVSSLKGDKMSLDSQLTRKEIAIVKMICKGYRNKDIMKYLDMSGPSVKKHLNNIYKKVGVKDRLQLAVYVINKWPFYIRET